MQATILSVDQSSQSVWKRHPQGVLDPDNLELSFSTSSGRPIKYYDDGMGPLWIYRDASGFMGIVRASDESSALEIVDDEFLPVVPFGQVHEAYGFDTPEAMLACRPQPGEDDTRELVEGYRYQANATDSGIVSYDPNGEMIEPLTLELAERLELQITVRM